VAKKKTEREEKKPKKPKPYNQKEFIEKVLRGAFKKTPMYHAAKRRAKEEFTVASKHGKPMRRVHFRCAKCGKYFLDKKGAKEIAVDHIESIVCINTGSSISTDIWARRLFCSEDNLQILCNYAGLRDGIKSCHKIKTAEEKNVLAKINTKNKSRGVESVEWASVAGFEDQYEVSNTGFVRNKRTEKLLTLMDNGRGYLTVCLGRAVAGKNTRRYIHRLVASAFLDRADWANEVNHKDGDKSNNYVTNLEWTDRQGNINHSWESNLSTPTPKKLDEGEVMGIFLESTSGCKPQSEIAESYGICQQTVSDIKNKKIWKHVTDSIGER